MYSTARLLTEEGIEGLGRYYSIYRGIVVDNNDTEKHMNRIKVCCPEVMGGIIFLKANMVLSITDSST